MSEQPLKSAMDAELKAWFKLSRKHIRGSCIALAATILSFVSWLDIDSFDGQLLGGIPGIYLFVFGAMLVVFFLHCHTLQVLDSMMSYQSSP